MIDVGNGPKARVRNFFKVVRNNKGNYPVIERELERIIGDDLDLNVQGYNGQTLLHLVVRLDDPNLIKLFYEKGVNLEVASVDGVSPLLYSVIKNKKRALDALIALGADVNSCAEYETNALCYAVMYNRVNMIKSLLKAGAVIDMPDEYNQTAFFFAIDTENIRCIKELIPYKPNPFICNSDDIELSDLVKLKSKEVQKIYDDYVRSFSS